MVDFKKLLRDDYVWTEQDRLEFIVAYHKQVVEWVIDGVVFPVVYLIAGFCLLNFICTFIN